MTRKQKRLAVIAGLSTVVLAAVVFIALAMSSTAAFFVVPSEVGERQIATGQAFRLGGIVKSDSWKQTDTVHDFAVTDCKVDVTAHFEGIMPDLFREGQEVILEGALDAGGTFIATNVLAKHDENYMPPEVAEALKASGNMPMPEKETYNK